jgi:GntR family transcriptional regulator
VRTDRSFVPAYFKLADDVKRRIIAGELKPGDMIPGESQFCVEYGISKMTVRQGLRLLAEEGMIESFRGKGTFVTRPRYNELTLELPDSQSVSSEGANAKLLGVDVIIANNEVASILKLRSRTKILQVRKLLLLDSRPVAFDRRFIIYRKGQPVIEEGIHYAAFPEFVSKHMGLTASRNKVTFSAVSLDEETARMLGTSTGKPALRIEQLVLGGEDQPLGWSVMICDGERYRLQAVTKGFFE